MKKQQSSVFDVSHEQRENDFSGTPYGFFAQMDKSGRVRFVEVFTAEDEEEVIVDHVVGQQCTEYTGVTRFCEVRSGGYVAVKPQVVPIGKDQ